MSIQKSTLIVTFGLLGACGPDGNADDIATLLGWENGKPPGCSEAITIPWLGEGNFWSVAWSEIDIEINWDGGYGDYDVGDYVMALEAPFVADDKAMFPIRLTGNATKYAPLWSAVGTDGCGNIYGQRSFSDAPVLVHSVRGGSWSGTGFYTNFADAHGSITVTSGSSMISSSFTQRTSFTNLTSVGYLDSGVRGAGTGCDYFAGYGTICGSDDPGNPEFDMMLEYWDASAGPVGMHVAYDYEDCIGVWCDGRHMEKRVEVYHFGDVSSIPSAFETEPDSRYEPTPFPVSEGALFTMFATVDDWDTPTATNTSGAPAEIHDWFRFEVTEDMVDPLTLEFYLGWNDSADLELHLFTAPDHPTYGFMHLAEGFDMHMDEFSHAKALSGTYSVPGPYLLGVVRRNSSAFTTNYGIMSYAAMP